MNELGRIADQLKRAYEGPAWSGPSLLDVLKDVTAPEAAARPIPNAHTIWEIVHHIRVWEDVVTRRLQGEPVREYSGTEDWPPVTDISDAAWQTALDQLKESNHRLREVINGFEQMRLSGLVPGADYSFYVLVQGAVQHDLYHAGQIGLLKKAHAAHTQHRPSST
jgi:uncharacterized damage-inducible protein DinB